MPHVLTHWQHTGKQLGLEWVTMGMVWGHLGINIEVIYIINPLGPRVF